MVIDRRVALILRGFDFYFTAFEAFHTHDGNMSKAFIGSAVISLHEKREFNFATLIIFITQNYLIIKTHWMGCALIKHKVLILVN